jgi:hypothetical protein
MRRRQVSRAAPGTPLETGPRWSAFAGATGGPFVDGRRGLLEAGATVYADRHTLITGNDASTSDGDVSGTLLTG